MTDLSITTTAIIPQTGAQIETVVANAAIAIGQAVYKDYATGKVGLADHDNATAAIRKFYGIALSSAAASGQQIRVIKKGRLAFGAILTAGTEYCVSGTAGGICPRSDVTTGDDVLRIGTAISTSVLEIQPLNTGVTL